MNMPTKYEVSMLNRSIDIEGVPKSPYLLLMYHVIPRMRNANFVNRYGDFGTPSISMERFNVETSNLVGIFTITSICQHMTIYPLKWAWSGSHDLNLKSGTPSITLERIKLRTPNFVG